MAHPVEDKARSVSVIVRALPEERDTWKGAALLEGKTLSEWIRDLLNDASERALAREDR
jgi:hypothetical protein